MVGYLWPIIREIVKTAIENRQNLVIEGCYIPFDWAADFDPFYRKDIRYLCLVMSEKYIANHFDDIRKYANIIEKRMDDSCYTLESALAQNRENLKMCQEYGCDYILIDDIYKVEPPSSLTAHDKTLWIGSSRKFSQKGNRLNFPASFFICNHV